MPFPSATRVVYNNNPLNQVVCQLRFPPILRIDAAPPADFQDRIRDKFPNFTETTDYKIETPVGMGENIPTEIIRQIMQSSSTKNYEFTSADGTLKLNLTRTFIALTTSQYIRWESYIENFVNPVKALIDIYSPVNFTRIGLRYSDVFKRSTLGLNDIPWRDLLSPALLGMIGSPEIADNIESFESVQVIKLTDKPGYARIRTKIIDDEEEKIFVLDSDFFDASKIEIPDAFKVLDFFNTRATRFIRWAISEHLHQALGPNEL